MTDTPEIMLLTPTDVCRMLQVTRGWLYDTVQAGKIPFVRVGRQLRFKPADIADWIDVHYEQAG